MRQIPQAGMSATVGWRFFRLVRQLSLGWLWLLVSCTAVATDFIFAPAPPDNPLKGFVAYPNSATQFPRSLEWAYTKLSEVMNGPDSFNWQPFDRKLDAAASRGCQFIARFYLEWPGQTSGVPAFLQEAGVTIRRWTNSQASPPEANLTPDYEDSQLRAALIKFIQALGRRYDGDPRLGFVQVGLLGCWGEWHTWPHDEWFASKGVQAEVLDAFEAAFKRTRIVARYPAGPGHARYTANAHRALGYHDDSFAWATTHTGKPGDRWFFETLLCNAGATNKWRQQPIGGEVRPEVWDTLFEEPSGAPPGQDFAACLAVTHASWLCNQGVFNAALSGAKRDRSLRAARQLGYELQVLSAQIDLTARELSVALAVTNHGVAPFYYDWPVELALIDASGKLSATSVTPWKLTAVQPSVVPVNWNFQLPLEKVAPGTCQLLLRVPNPMPGGRPLRFANQTQDQDRPGWLTLGSFLNPARPAK